MGIKILYKYSILNYPYLQIIDPKREFLAEEPVTIMIKKTFRPALAYFLTDLIVFVERLNYNNQEKSENYKYLSFLRLTHNSFIKQFNCEDDFLCFNVSGSNQNLIFLAENKETLVKLTKILGDLINNIKEKK